MRKHRGLSAVIGTVFLVAVVIGALSYVTYSMNTLGNFSESLMTEDKRQKDKQGEQFEISSLSITPASKIDGIVKNTGDVPLEVKTLWIEEVGNPESIKRFDVNTKIAPGDKINLINSIDFNIDNTKGYALKLVSSRGEIQTSYLNSATIEPLFMNLHVIPQKISTGFPATILFTVVNNMSNNNILYNLTPVLDVSSANGLASSAYISGPIPPNYPVLKPGDIATFEFIYTVSGLEGQYIDFGASLQNGYPLDANHFQALNNTSEVKDVEVALNAGSALTSLGLDTANSNNVDLFLLHDETWGIPTGVNGRQMQNTKPDTAGVTYNTFSSPKVFFSSNMTQTITVQPGYFNMSLQYYSNATSPSLPVPSFAFFFECDNCPEADRTTESTGYLDAIDSGKGRLKKDGDNLPVWRDPTNPSYGDGPHKDGYYSFTGNDQFLKDDWKVENGAVSNIGAPPDTDAVWFRINSGSISNYMPLIRYGDNDDSKNPADSFEISIGSAAGTAADKGKIRLKIIENTVGSGGTATCISTTQYHLAPYLGKWQHIVGVRESNGQCTLYVNGTKIIGPTGSGVGSYADDIKKIGIGTINFGRTDSTNNLNGDVAKWMHWNNNALTASQVQELFYTNYGVNGTRVHLTINRTDSSGNVLGGGPLIDVPLFSLPFKDPAKKSASFIPYYASYSDSNANAINKYSQSNVTGYLSASTDFITGQRLVAGIKIDDNTQNLPIYIKIDDTDFVGTTLDNSSPFLQTPPTTSPWPSYLSFKTDAEVTLTIFNSGPEGLWLTFPGTRMVLTSIDSLTSYGAMPKSIDYNGKNDYSLDYDTDGPYLPNQASLKIVFWPLINPVTLSQPNPVTSAPVVAGNYKASIYLSGYDEKGSAFLRTVDLGLVNIHN